MKLRFTFQEVPQTVIIGEEKTEAEYRLREAIKSINQAWQKLNAFEDLQPIPPLQQATVAWLNSIIDAKIDAIRLLPLPQAEKKELSHQWMMLRKDAGNLIRRMDAIRQTWPLAKWEQDTTANTITCSNAAELAEGMSRKPVPREAQQHLDRLCKVAQAIDDLRRWEQRYNVPKMRLESLASLTNEDLFERWASGLMRQDNTPSSDNYDRQLRAGREFIQSKYI